MKRIITITALLIAVFIAGSCTKDVTKLPQNAATVNTYFQTSKDITSALSGMYGSFLSTMVSTGGTNGGGSNNYFAWGETRSDNFAPSGYPTTATENINNNAILNNNASADWAGLYQTISRANLNIANIPNGPKSDQRVTQTA